MSLAQMSKWTQLLVQGVQIIKESILTPGQLSPNYNEELDQITYIILFNPQLYYFNQLRGLGKYFSSVLIYLSKGLLPSVQN